MKSELSQKNIPKGWSVTKLSSVGVFSKGSSISKEQLSTSGHNAIRYGELYTKHHFHIRKIYSYISDEVAEQATKIKYGDIIFAGSGETIDEIGKSAAYLLKEDAYAGGDIIIFSPNKVNSLFLSFFLNVGEGRKKLRELGQGQSVVHIYKRDIEKLKLNLPPLLEQNRIVSVLETWDQAIEKLKRKIEIKKEVKKGLMQELLTGKTRLPGFSDEWHVKELSSLCNITTGKKDVNEGNPHGLYPFFTCAREHTYSDQYSFDTEAILVAGNADVGHCKYYQGKFEAYQRTYVLSNFKGIDGKYLFLFLSHYFKNQIESLKQIGAMSYIKLPMLQEFPIRVPTTNEQKAISQLIMTSEAEIVDLRKKLKLVTNQKKYLLNNLVTGKIRTPETLSIPK